MKIENIKFKAKRLDNSEWVEGYYVKKTTRKQTPKGDVVEDGEEHLIFGMSKEDVQPLCYEVDPSTICQFTGLTDCKGKEIWEHDLLQSQETKAIYEVVWNQGNTSFSLVNTECPVLYSNTLGGMLRNRRLKVVGNKFDKKEVAYED